MIPPEELKRREVRQSLAFFVHPDDAKIIEIPNKGHPYGVRGVGETAIVPPLATVANAIYSATGIRMTELPMSPPVLLDALEKRDQV